MLEEFAGLGDDKGAAGEVGQGLVGAGALAFVLGGDVGGGFPGGFLAGGVDALVEVGVVRDELLGGFWEGGGVGSVGTDGRRKRIQP